MSALSRSASANFTPDFRRPAVKIGCETCGTKLQALCGPLNSVDNWRALPAQQSAEADLRKIRGLRDADVGVGSDQVLLRGQDVRPSFEQRGRQSSGHLGRQFLLHEILAADDSAGILPEQQSNLILGLLDLLLKPWDRLFRRIDQLLRLAQIE